MDLCARLLVDVQNGFVVFVMSTCSVLGPRSGTKSLGFFSAYSSQAKPLQGLQGRWGGGGGTGAQVDLYSDGVDSRGADKGTGGADEAESLQESKGPRCTLCLETRKFTTATECGPPFLLVVHY